MKSLIPIFMVLLAAGFTACSSSTEYMADAPGGGRKYLWHNGQIGGQGTWQNSMGSAGAFDGQKSFADFMQTMGFAYASWSAASVQKAKEVTAQFKAGEITKQQAQAQFAAIEQAEIAAGVRGAEVINPNIALPIRQ